MPWPSATTVVVPAEGTRQAWEPPLLWNQRFYLEEAYPWTEEPGGLQSKALQRAGHNWARMYVAQWIITADGVPTTEMDYVALNVILNQAWATGEIGWDLGPFTKVLAPGQTSGLGAMEYNHTLRDWKQLNACTIRKVTHKKVEKGQNQQPFPRCWEQKQGMVPAQSTTKGMGRPPKPPLKPQPINVLPPSPTKGASQPFSEDEQGHC